MQDTVAYVGMAFIVMSYVPQLLHTHRLRKTREISLVSLQCNFLGTLMMLLFAVFNDIKPMILTNAAILICVLLLLLAKLVLFANSTPNVPNVSSSWDGKVHVHVFLKSADRWKQLSNV